MDIGPERAVEATDLGHEPGSIDARNEAFWAELCGTSLAQSIGVRDRDAASLERFDQAYMSFYPYLAPYVDRLAVMNRRVLEIGLGYGTLGAYLARQGAIYYGVDISPAPADMMRKRLTGLGAPVSGHVLRASAASLPFPNHSFDRVVSIGCLHHTGALRTAIDEVYRVLVPGGTALIMLYNARSARQLVRVHLARALRRLARRGQLSSADVARMYDTDTAGREAPHTEFVSPAEARRLFAAFDGVEVRPRNFEDVRLRGRRLVSRDRLLGTPLERWFGLDLYIVARRPVEPAGSDGQPTGE